MNYANSRLIRDHQDTQSLLSFHYSYNIFTAYNPSFLNSQTHSIAILPLLLHNSSNSHQPKHTNQNYTRSITSSSTINSPHQNYTPSPPPQQTHHLQHYNQTERLNYHYSSTPTQCAPSLSPLHPTPSAHFTHPPTHNRVCTNRFLPKSMSCVDTSSSNSSANGNEGG